MTQIITRQNYPQPQQQSPEKLFTGIFLRWKALTVTEKVVCGNIVLVPVWWFVGITQYMLLFLSLGIVFYERRRYGIVRLKRPSLIVIALFAFYAYGYVDNFLISFDAYPSIDIPPGMELNPNSLIKGLFSFAIPFLVWYVQSNKVRVRLEVVVWACSVTIIQMLLGYLIFQFAFPGIMENPPRTLYAVLTGKGRFNPEDVNGWGNYLIFFESLHNETRFRFFFDHYQTAATFIAFTALLAFDLKNRLWSLLLIVACCFLLNLAAARAIWVAFLPAVFVRYCCIWVKARSGWLFLAFFAIVSFITLSISPVTNEVLNIYTDTQQLVGNARAGSTEARAKVYNETLERIPDKIIFGHKVPGPKARKGPSVLITEPPRIGTHSFILGSLLYQKGLVGTGIFATFWASLIIWLYKTRVGRPLGCFLVLLMLTLTSVVSIIHFTMTTSTLLCMLIRQPTETKLNTHRR